MARILLLNPSRWGRGITPIWIASHTATLRAAGHEVALFDATFFRDWALDENSFNTANGQYRSSDYDQYIVWNTGVTAALQRAFNEFEPDFVFWSAISSHIHGEGEYAALEYGYELMSHIKKDATWMNATLMAGGLRATADWECASKDFPGVILFRGETEFSLPAAMSPSHQIKHGPVDLEAIGPYDYSLFDDQVFWRPYNGQVVRAVDYEMSRGCPFTCGYCVETVIQRHYGFTEQTARGALVDAKGYLRHKSAKRIFEEINSLYRDYGITLFRCQDTNFLTIDRETLADVANMMANAHLPIMLYIETRPEGINPRTVDLLKRLQVDGVGMGVELAGQDWREGHLNRFCDQDKIVRAFDLLRSAGIKRTAYNVIGFPGQSEESIHETIAFNQRLDPDNITVAFYTPYAGTEQQQRGAESGQYPERKQGLDSQLRTVSTCNADMLEHYKRNFVALVRGEHVPA